MKQKAQMKMASEARATIIDDLTTFDGTLSTAGDLRIEGHVTGQVDCDGTLTVADGATVDAGVNASDIIVSGTLSGTISCRGRLDVRDTGIVRGRVETGRLAIQEGGIYEGHLTMLSTEASDDDEDVADEPLAAQDDEAALEGTAEELDEQNSTTYSFFRSFAQQRRDGDDVSTPGRVPPSSL